ncbi:uncharacterized protein LOC132375057 isoform X2 [Balaenoptera ricei]|nr:uncharacterized protein LOC132375057 isoform X2 [Balaenoptera ricei]
MGRWCYEPGLALSGRGPGSVFSLHLAGAPAQTSALLSAHWAPRRAQTTLVVSTLAQFQGNCCDSQKKKIIMDVENKCDHCVVLRAENERKTPPELAHSCVTEEGLRKRRPRRTDNFSPTCTSELAGLPGKPQSMNGLLTPPRNKQRNSQHRGPPPGWPPCLTLQFPPTEQAPTPAWRHRAKGQPCLLFILHCPSKSLR